MWLPSRSWVSGGLNFRASVGRNRGEGNGTPLQYSCLENPTDRGAWWAVAHGVAEGRTRLSDFTFTFRFHALEKEMATHSSVLAWRIPGTGEPGGLPSLGSHRVRHDCSSSSSRRNRTGKQREASLCFSSRWHHNLTFRCLHGQGSLL